MRKLRKVLWSNLLKSITNTYCYISLIRKPRLPSFIWGREAWCTVAEKEERRGFYMNLIKAIIISGPSLTQYLAWISQIFETNQCLMYDLYLYWTLPLLKGPTRSWTASTNNVVCKTPAKKCIPNVLNGISIAALSDTTTAKMFTPMLKVNVPKCCPFTRKCVD